MLLGLIVTYGFEAAGGAAKVAVPAAAGIEFLAAAASALDDIQDGDEIAGVSPHDHGAAAELVTVLLTLAHRGLSLAVESIGPTAPDPRSVFRKLWEFELQALKGQHLSNQSVSSSDQRIERSLATTGDKSGYLGRLAGEIGASLVTSDSEVIDTIGEWGWHLLVVDQLQNDIAAVWPEGPDATDIRLDRNTVPISFARTIDESADGPMHGAPENEIVDLPESESEQMARWRIFLSGGVHFSLIAAIRHRHWAAACAARQNVRNPASLLTELLEP